jgi:very-short-patch-repair endonuclease
VWANGTFQRRKHAYRPHFSKPVDDSRACPQISASVNDYRARPHAVSMVSLDSASVAQPFRGTTRKRQWQRLSRGVYVPRTSARCLTEVLRGWELVLPKSAAFTSLTAAELYGWWLPQEVPHPVFATVPIGNRYPERKGLLVYRHSGPIPCVAVGGLRVTSATETLLAAARDLGLLDLVIMGDSALRSGHCTVEQLWVTAAKHCRGAPRLRALLPLLDDRSESPWESVMRVLHTRADIRVEPQKVIYDQWGRFVARGDLWLVGTRRIHEYDGEVHRDRQMHRGDLARDRRLVEIDWQRVSFTSPQLLHEGASIIASADRLLGRAWNPQRLAGWEAFLDESLFRPPGRSRAARRWQRAM